MPLPDSWGPLLEDVEPCLPELEECEEEPEAPTEENCLEQRIRQVYPDIDFQKYVRAANSCPVPPGVLPPINPHTPNPPNIPVPAGVCIQFGTSGSFIAGASGTLMLYANDEIGFFGDNSQGEVPLSITFTPGSTYVVDPLEQDGVVGPTVISGVTYSFTATGTYSITGESVVDPDGAFVGGSVIIPTGSLVCDGKTPYSIVGKIVV